MTERASVDAFIGLGSNLGDRRGHLEAAIAALAELPGAALIARSSLYSSAPLDADGGDYLNAVVKLRTTLAAEDLLAAMQDIERQQGRERPYRHAPRTLDLDLLVFGDLEQATPTLTLPHPRMAERAFVLVPLVEIAPLLELPRAGLAARLLQALGGQRLAKLDP